PREPGARLGAAGWPVSRSQHDASAGRWATGGAELVAFSLDQPCSASFSVEAFERAREVWRNDDLAPERAVEGVSRCRTLEAGASAAGIGAATLALRFGRQRA